MDKDTYFLELKLVVTISMQSGCAQFLNTSARIILINQIASYDGYLKFRTEISLFHPDIKT